MPVIQSQIKTSSPEFKQKDKNFRLLLQELHSAFNRTKEAETSEAVKKNSSRGKLLPAERIATLADPGSAVLSIGTLAGLGMYDGVPPGAGIETCITNIAGRRCMVVANNPMVKGGTYYPMTVKKHLRAQEIAMENRLPCIYLVDSGGAFLPLQAEVFPDREHFGRIFYNQAQMSAMGIPQVSVVLGSCTAGGAYVPAMSEETVMVQGNASIFLGGPPLVRAATGEEVSVEELGGAEVHTAISGVADHKADSEQQALEIARNIVRNLGTSNSQSNFQRLQPDVTPEAPLYASEEIYGIVGTDLMKSFPVREVIARIVDGSQFHEFKKNYGATLVCGFAHIQGFHVGIIANDGILFSESALKGAHFIQLAEQRGIPLLFLQNIVGFMVGKKYEHEGIAKHGAKLVTAVATCNVPKFTLIIGGSFGAGNYGMCGRAFSPRFLFTWPNSKISVMGGEQAASVLAQVKTESSKKELETLKAQTREKYETEGSCFYASARLWDDGVIDPATSRNTLALALASSGWSAQKSCSFGVFRM